MCDEGVKSPAETTADGAPARLPDRLARWLTVVVMAITPLTTLAGLAPFSYGIWYQSEPGTAAVLAMGALAAATLGLRAKARTPVVPVFGNPAVLVGLTIAAASLLLAPLHPFPVRTVLGHTESGEGALAYIAFALIAAVFALGWRDAVARIAATVGGGVALGVCLALTLRPIEGLGLPVRWPDYLGFVGLFAAIVVMAQPWDRRLRIGIALVVSVACLALSGSQTVQLLAVLVGPVLAVFGRILPFSSFRRVAAVIVGTGLLAMPAGLAAVGMAGGLSGVGMHDPSLVSLESRLRLAAVAAVGAIDGGWALLFGNGWGGFNDVLFRHAFAVPGVTNFVGTAHAPNWEGLGYGAFHPHNGLLEALLALGVVGPILVLFLWVWPILQSRPEDGSLPVAAWAVIALSTGGWFMVPQVWPWFAMAAGLIGTRSPRHDAEPTGNRVPFIPNSGDRLRLLAVMTCLGILCAGLLAGLHLQIRAALAGRTLIDAVAGPAPSDPQVRRAFVHDDGRGGQHLTWVAANLSRFLIEQAASGRILTSDQILWYQTLQEEIDRMVTEGRTDVRLHSRSVAIRAELASDIADPGLVPLRDRLMPGWSDAIVSLVRRVPTRPDIAAPFFFLVVQTGNWPLTVAFAERVLAVSPRDPVALYFSGLALLRIEMTHQAGLLRLIEADHGGVDRFVPMNEDLRRLIRASAGH